MTIFFKVETAYPGGPKVNSLLSSRNYDMGFFISNLKYFSVDKIFTNDAEYVAKDKIVYGISKVVKYAKNTTINYGVRETKLDILTQYEVTPIEVKTCNLKLLYGPFINIDRPEQDVIDFEWGLLASEANFRDFLMKGSNHLYEISASLLKRGVQ